MEPFYDDDIISVVKWRKRYISRHLVKLIYATSLSI